MPDNARLIDDYAAGPRLLRDAVAGMTREQLSARPVPGRWSSLEVVAHIADFEPVYADRMKRIIAENEPTMFGGDPDAFAARLAYQSRDVETELAMIDAVRRHVAQILRTLESADFDRVGRHSTDGPLTLATVLQRIAAHIPHHIPFIMEKRQALGAQ
jgi:hypothetical protein